MRNIALAWRMIEQKHSEVWKNKHFLPTWVFFLYIEINLSVLANIHCSNERIRTLPQQWLWKTPPPLQTLAEVQIFHITVFLWTQLCSIILVFLFFFFLFLHLPFCSSLNDAFCLPFSSAQKRTMLSWQVWKWHPWSASESLPCTTCLIRAQGLAFQLIKKTCNHYSAHTVDVP